MKKIYFWVVFILAFILMALSISAFDIAVEDENGNVYHHDSYTFYLPSHIKPESIKLILGEDKTLSIGGVSVNGTSVDISSYALKTDNGAIYIVPVMFDGYDSFLNFRFATSLPSVYVQTSLSEEYIIKYAYKDTGAHTTIINENGSIEFEDVSGNSEFKIRGNTTRDYAKKPFQLKLSQKSDIFGMGKSKTWILLANYLDQSLIRNSIMYEIGKYLGMQTSNFTSVDLYINGNYYGIYLLCEKVQISSTRLDIHELEKDNDELNSTYKQFATSVTSGELIDSTILTEYRYIEGVKNPSDITGGYLIELDNNYYKDELCYFVTENGNHYVIKSPEYASREEVEYIARLFAEMEEAIMSGNGYNRLGKHYTEYIDIDSFAAAYIVAELGRNFDAGSSSMYFYKDKDVDGKTSKIFKGPLWDCDNTLGNIHKNGASSIEGYWAGARSIWSGLTKKSDFNRLVKEKFESAYDFIFDMIDKGGFVDKQVEELGDSIYMEQKRWGSNDYSKWPLYYDGTHYDKWQSSQVFNFASVYSQGNNEDESTVIGYLCEHIENRTNWLATEWNCDVTLRQRSFTVPVIPEPTPDDETETDTDIEIDSDTDSEIESDSDIESDTSTEPSTETETSTETDLEQEPETDTSLDTDSESEKEESGHEPETDMTPDFEEPPEIKEPSEKEERKGIFSFILQIFKPIINFLRPLFGLPKI